MRSPTSGREAPPWRRSRTAGIADERDAEQLHHVAEVEGRACRNPSPAGARAPSRARSSRRTRAGRCGAESACRSASRAGRAASTTRRRTRAGRTRAELPACGHAGHGGGEDEADGAQQQDRGGESGLQRRAPAPSAVDGAWQGRAVRASTAPPAGSEAAPARAMTPLGPTMIPRRREPVDQPAARSWSRTRRPQQDGAPVVGSAHRRSSARPRRRRRRARRSRRARSGPRRRSGPRGRRRHGGLAGTPTAHAQMSASNPRGACPFFTIEALSADQRTMCSPIIEGTIASPFVTGSTVLPSSSAASLRAIAARITVAPATRSGSGGTIFGGGSTHAQPRGVLGAPERQRRERAPCQVRRPDAVASVAERRPRAAALERHDGGQMRGDVDRPAPGVLDPPGPRASGRSAAARAV